MHLPNLDRCSGQSTAPCFDIFEDVANFWDKHLREPTEAGDSAIDGGDDDVRVFTLGTEKWGFHKEWPATGDAARHIAFALSGNGNLEQVRRSAVGVDCECMLWRPF